MNKQEVYTDLENQKSKLDEYSQLKAEEFLKFSFLPLTFIEYHDFVKSMKVYPDQHKIVYPTLGMMGEAGEASEKVKKWLRGDRELDKKQLALEVSDVLWYISALADDLGYTLQDIANMNIEKLSSRKERGVVKGSGDER